MLKEFQITDRAHALLRASPSNRYTAYEIDMSVFPKSECWVRASIQEEITRQALESLVAEGAVRKTVARGLDRYEIMT